MRACKKPVPRSSVRFCKALHTAYSRASSQSNALYFLRVTHQYAPMDTCHEKDQSQLVRDHTRRRPQSPLHQRSPEVPQQMIPMAGRHQSVREMSCMLRNLAGRTHMHRWASRVRAGTSALRPEEPRRRFSEERTGTAQQLRQPCIGPSHTWGPPHSIIVQCMRDIITLPLRHQARCMKVSGAAFLPWTMHQGRAEIEPCCVQCAPCHR